MSETSQLESLPESKEVEISLENEESNILCTLEESYELKEVEEDMELLELNDSKISESIFLQLSKKLEPPAASPRLATTNRRYTLRPQRRPETTECDNYSSASKRKKITSLPKNGYLETIFESPILKNGSITLLGKSKLKRCLSFNSFVSKTKLRHRKLKLKRLSKGKRKKSNCKVTIEDVKRKLKDLEDEDDEWMDIKD